MIPNIPPVILENIGPFIGARWYSCIGPEQGRITGLSMKAAVSYIDLLSLKTQPGIGFRNAIFIRELTKNAAWHGSKAGEQFTVGAIVGEKSFAISTHDNGGYFGNKKIKNMYESFTPIKSSIQSESNIPIGANKGNEILRLCSSTVHVDTVTETLYAVLRDKHIVLGEFDEDYKKETEKTAYMFIKDIEEAREEGYKIDIEYEVNTHSQIR